MLYSDLLGSDPTTSMASITKFIWSWSFETENDARPSSRIPVVAGRHCVMFVVSHAKLLMGIIRRCKLNVEHLWEILHLAGVEQLSGVADFEGQQYFGHVFAPSVTVTVYPSGYYDDAEEEAVNFDDFSKEIILID